MRLFHDSKVSLALTLAISACDGSYEGAFFNSVRTDVPREQSAPTIEVKFPPSSSLTDSDTVLIIGSAYDDSAISAVVVNGVAAKTTNGFIDWHAEVNLTHGTNIVTVSSEDELGNYEGQAATVSIRREPIIGSISNIEIDNIGKRVFFVDTDPSAIYELDLETGLHGLVSKRLVKGEGPGFGTIRALAHDTNNDRLLALNSQTHIVAINLNSGDRSIFRTSYSLIDSSASDIAIDSVRNRALIAGYSWPIIAVDLETAEQSVLLDAPVNESGIQWLPASIAMESAGDTAILSEFSRDLYFSRISEIDLNSAEKVVLAGIPTDRHRNLQLVQLVTQRTPEDVLFLKQGLPSSIGALALGNTEIQTAPQQDPWRWVRDMKLDSDGERLLYVDGSASIHTFSVSRKETDELMITGIGSGDELPERAGFIFDPDTDTLLLNDLFERCVPQEFDDCIETRGPGLLSVDVATGRREQIRYNGGGGYLGAAGGIDGDLKNGVAYVLNYLANTIVAIDLESGEGELLLALAPPEIYATSNLLLLDGGERLVYSEGAEILALKIIEGNVTLISGELRGVGPPLGRITGIAAGRNSNELFALYQHSLEAAHVVAIDVQTGNRELLVEIDAEDIPDARVKFLPQGRFHFSASANEFVFANIRRDHIFSIDIDDGSRRILSGSNTGRGPELVGLSGLAYDEGRGTIFALGRYGMYAIDAVTGDRLLISR